MKRNHPLTPGSTSTPGERHCAFPGLGTLEEVQQSTSALPGRDNLPSWGGLPGWWLRCDSGSWAAPRSTRRHLWECLHDCMRVREQEYILRSTSASKHPCLAPVNTSWQPAHAQGIPFVIPCPKGFGYSEGAPCCFGSDANDPDYGSQGGKAHVTQPEPSSHQAPLQTNLSITVYILRIKATHLESLFWIVGTCWGFQLVSSNWTGFSSRTQPSWDALS